MQELFQEFQSINFSFLKKPFKSVIIIVTLIRTFFTLLQLIIINHLNEKIGISNKVYASFTAFFISLSQELQLMPILNLSCTLCPKNSEAFIFESIMMFKDASYSISYRLGGVVTKELGIQKNQFGNLWKLQMIYALIPVGELVLLAFLKVKSSYLEEILEAQNFVKRKKLVEEEECTNCNEQEIEQISQDDNLKEKLLL
eukprot:TRINITY_DN6550_c0_g1_i1.p1 TRINITY_DN6550_c0_g1~~TRINITY_DN6550_c0_g1_i1.p1  ORF type:complete len:200 (+),score=22.06 TRINITY_DN6550_c0_g1_i1:390-989(+)